ncbi:MAG: carboxypeptidase regulatory-like domain-containing protein [Ignavibacteria bacterium]|nr:carboxypeptidase regulatory-like domain-containing protein [Ignavibacteria bacterium]
MMTKAAGLLLLCCCFNALQGQTAFIRGTVTGTAGKPLPMAHVWLSETGEHGDKWMLKVRNDGSFFFPAEKPGAYIFSATGVNHSAATSTVFLKPGDTIRADVTLGGLRFKDSDGAPLVVGAFSKYWCEKGLPMQRGADGIWRASVPGTDSVLRCAVKQSNTRLAFACSNTMRYDLSKDRSAVSPGGAKLTYDALIPVNDGMAQVSFDPSTVSQSREASEIRFADRLHQTLYATHEEFSNFGGFGMFGSTYFKRLHRTSIDKSRVEDAITVMDDALASADDPILKACLAIHRLRLQDLVDDVTEAQASACFAVAHADAPLWAAFPETFAVALAPMRDDEALLSTLDGFLRAHQGENAGACALFSLMEDATAQRRRERFVALHERFTERYPHSEYHSFLASDYLSSASSPGAPCPAFVARMRDDSSRVISNESVRGKVTLLWFTMPGQWEQEKRLERLRALHNKYRDAGFALVNVRCMPERKGESGRTYPEPDMPWQRAALPDYSNVPLVKTLRIWIFPYIVLLDKTGAILATSAGLRDDKALDALIAEATKK